MALEEFKARISLLLGELAQRPDDPHAILEQLREQLEGLKAMGMPLPADLVELERSLEAEFEAEARPRRRRAEEPPEPPEG